MLIQTGGSAFLGSMPRTFIERVNSVSSLDEAIPEKFRQLDILGPLESEEAGEKYPSYKKALEDVDRYADEFSNALSKCYAYKDNPTLAQHNVFYSQPEGEGYYAHEGYSREANGTADLYLRAKIHEMRHSAAIKNAFKTNGNSYPATYKQPKSEWWW